MEKQMEVIVDYTVTYNPERDCYVLALINKYNGTIAEIKFKTRFNATLAGQMILAEYKEEI